MKDKDVPVSRHLEGRLPHLGSVHPVVPDSIGGKAQEICWELSGKLWTGPGLLVERGACPECAMTK